MEKSVNTTLGQRLDQAIRARKTSNKALALQVGVSGSAIGDIVNDQTKDPSVNLIIRIALKLGIDFNWLCMGIGEMEPGDTLSRKSKDGGAFGREVEEETKSEMEMLKTQLADALKDKELYRSIVESPLVQQALGKLSGNQQIALVNWLKSQEKTFQCAFKGYA